MNSTVLYMQPYLVHRGVAGRVQLGDLQGCEAQDLLQQRLHAIKGVQGPTPEVGEQGVKVPAPPGCACHQLRHLRKGTGRGTRVESTALYCK